MPATTLDEGQFDTIPECIESFRRGEFLLVLDDPGRENEGDLIIAADNITAEQLGWMVHHSSGFLCVALNPKRADALDLPPMVAVSQDPRGTAYTVSVDGAHPDITTGISAHDRALTCRTLGDADSKPDSLRRPGHIMPLRAHPGGVRRRVGHTEAATEFCRLTGKVEAGVLSEVVDAGEEVVGRAERTGVDMLRGQGCISFARKWGIKVCTIADLVDYVEKTEGKLDVNGSS